jgi:hypothetical protein
LDWYGKLTFPSLSKVSAECKTGIVLREERSWKQIWEWIGCWWGNENIIYV